ncbi:MAG: isopenicillin N synthase family oxygenase [Myxococcales bacterium]|nr:isopenicillin N synthase family oxygenase [Myxococcales bacterium]
MRSVPVVDLGGRSGRSVADDRAVVDAVHRALAEFGFVSIVGHGVDPALIHRCYAEADRVFSLPLPTKRACETPEDGRKRGYTSFGVEHAKDQPVGDLKEFWHVGREGVAELPVNHFPAEVPGFGPAMMELFDALDEFSHTLLRLVAAGLGLSVDWFVDQVTGGNSVLRVIHYPPIGAAAAPGAVRAAAHEDINLLTVLPVSTQPGLELLTHDGDWIAVDPPAGAFVCDTGDMMQLVTEGTLPATTHRVVNPSGPSPNVSRLSMPFFVHPRGEVRLDPIDGSRAGPTAETFLMERLRAIGVA